ncbi:MAG TPA: hypothetical protein VKX49_21660 [Bryobacteraceae bacterium]|nr:hypothetical protein [Bryobacteraceae bacterium]
MIQTAGTPEAEIERLLNSYTLRSSEALRHLLRYLADKALNGEADRLKEYTIGLDALGKPPSFDPRHDAIVRLQVGRLRQKLEEYYRNEGQSDPVVIELPKGHYKLTWSFRSLPEPESAADSPAVDRQNAPQWRYAAIALAAVLLVVLGWASYATYRAFRSTADWTSSSLWNTDLEQLWQPFLVNDQALTIAITDPLFIALQGTGAMFRTRALNRWEDATRSPEVEMLRNGLGKPKITATFAYTGIGEANAAFLLGRLLGTREQHMSLARISQVSWQEATYSNMVLIGPARVLSEGPLGAPVDTDFVQDSTGIHNLHPRPGEPSFFADPAADEFLTNGSVYALVTITPGPFGKTAVLSFISNRTWGRLGAVRSFTDPALAHVLVTKLKKPSGELPRSYQIVLRVEFRDGVPTNVSYVLHRELSQRPHTQPAQ